MDLFPVRNAFNRASKKQKTWYGKTQEDIDKVLEVITNAIIELSIVPEEAPAGVHQKLVMEVLQVENNFCNLSIQYHTFQILKS